MAASRPHLAIRFGFLIGLGFCASLPAAAREAVLKLPHAQVETLNFAALAGWSDDDHAAAYSAFLKSCSAILQGGKAVRAARPLFGALFKVCERTATAANSPSDKQARAFFEDNFKPVRIAPQGQTEGFFTGYYETEFVGSRVPTDEFKIPIYAAPADTVRKRQSRVFAHFDRTAIENGALKGRKLEICYVKNPVDAFFAQIQGSTRVKLDDGKLLRLNYVASNGQRYTPVGKFLIDRGIIAKEDMSMDRIRDWMDANPDEGRELRRKNRSFVFFRETALAPHDECIGAQGIPLTPGRSLAVDKRIHVYGTPIWIDAELPILSEKPDTKFRRLLFAQDTGSAIVGPARADIYFGAGEEIGHIAGRIKQFGQFVMLVPRSLAVNGSGAAPANNIPLPLPRPKAILADALSTASATAPLPKQRP
ncbi:MAG: MltA domain-containing protein [Rhizobiales bacterium]|nr:MltA domain-containing protein [Hyphomicrobiales bacterium]